METSKHPYEFLVRWDQQGMLSGAHVIWRYVMRDGDVIVTESLSLAEPVAVGLSGGFPLADILPPHLLNTQPA